MSGEGEKMSGEGDDAAVASTLRMAVVTRPRVYLTPERSEAIKYRISWCIFYRVGDSSDNLPRFRGNPILRDGVLYFECADKSSCEILIKYFTHSDETDKKTISILGFSHASINFESEANIPKLVKCSIKMSNFTESAYDFHRFLDLQNPIYSVAEWFYHSCERRERTSPLTITYYVPEKTVSRIKEENFELSFGFGCVTLDVHKED